MHSKVKIFALEGILVILLVSGTKTMVSASHWSWTPSLTLSERYDDNLFLARENRSSDFVSILTPQLRIESPVDQNPLYTQYREDNPLLLRGNRSSGFGPFSSPRLRISSPVGQQSRYIEYYADIQRYANHSELDTVNHFSEVEWTSYLSKSAMVSLSDNFGFTSDSTEISGLGVAVPRGDSFRNISAIGLELPWAVLSYQYGLQAFEGASLIDSQSHIFVEQLALPLFSDYWLTQSYLMRYFLQDGTEELRSHTVGTGLRSRITPTFTLAVEGGIAYWRDSTNLSFQTSPMGFLDLEKSFRNLTLSFSVLEDIGTQFLGSAEYALRHTVLRLNGFKAITAGGGGLEGSTDQQGASVNLQRDITRRAKLDLTAGYGSSRPIHEGQGRSTSYRGETDFSYTLRPWLSMGVRYSYIKQDADNPAQQEFRRHQGTVSLTTTLP